MTPMQVFLFSVRMQWNVHIFLFGWCLCFYMPKKHVCPASNEQYMVLLDRVIINTNRFPICVDRSNRINLFHPSIVRVPYGFCTGDVWVRTGFVRVVYGFRTGVVRVLYGCRRLMFDICCSVVSSTHWASSGRHTIYVYIHIYRCIILY